MNDKPGTTPRPAATILLLRDHPLEVLTVRRRKGGVFASALVFPGGLVEAEDRSDAWLPLLRNHQGLSQDERALRIAAVRETYEEVGILLADSPLPALPSPLPGSGAKEFRELVEAAGARLDLAGLTPFGHWVTPTVAAKRFDTHFFLARAPEGQEGDCDGRETVALEWIGPAQALERAAGGDIGLLFPTRMNLKRLAESTDSADAIAAAAARPVFRVEPVVHRMASGVRVVIPDEAGYGETEEFRPLSA